MSTSKRINRKSIFSLRFIRSTTFGVFISVVATKRFMIPNNIVDGDVKTISIFFKEIFQIIISIFLVVLNLPFIYMGYRITGMTFAVKSLIAVLLLAFLMLVLNAPTVTRLEIHRIKQAVTKIDPEAFSMYKIFRR